MRAIGAMSGAYVDERTRFKKDESDCSGVRHCHHSMSSDALRTESMYSHREQPAAKMVG